MQLLHAVEKARSWICSCLLLAGFAVIGFSQDKAGALSQEKDKPKDLPQQKKDEKDKDPKATDKDKDKPKTTALAAPKAVEPAKTFPGLNADIRKLSLSECLAIAEANHPLIKIANLSLSQTRKGMESLYNLPSIANRLKPEIAIRKQQADKGIIVAEANVAKARQEVASDVCRLYYTYIYAKQLDFVVNDILEQLKIYEEFVEKFLEKPTADNKLKITSITRTQINLAVDQAKSKMMLAKTGQMEALSALRNAMGIDPTFNDFEPKETELPIMGGTISQELIVELSMTRRPEMIQAAAATDAFRLEACAQDLNKYGLQVNTLAAGTDLHANMVPITTRTLKEYRPGATAPEMPAFLFGKRVDRVSRAIEISRRQDFQYEQVKNLIQAQAVNSYWEWYKTSQIMQIQKRRFDNGRKLQEGTKKNVASVVQIDLIQNYANASLAQVDYIDAVKDHILSLINLELVTAGAIKAGFPGR